MDAATWPAPRRVLIVDDHRSFAEALSIAIDAEQDLECVAVAASAGEAADAALRTSPQLAVVDMQLPDAPGPQLVQRLHHEHPQLLVLAITAYADTAVVAAAADAGACAFLRKECSVTDIVDSLRRAADGDMVIHATTLRSMLQRPPTPPPREPVSAPNGVSLTPREHEVLELVAQAVDARGIASHLGISIHTVRGYLKSLLAKFEVHTQLELLVRASSMGLLPDPAPSVVVDLTGAAPTVRRDAAFSYAS